MYNPPPGFLGFLLCRLNTTQQDFVAGLENPGQFGCLGSTQHTIAIRATQVFCNLATHISTLATHVPGILSQSAENLNTPRPAVSLFRSLLAPCGSGRPKNLIKYNGCKKTQCDFVAGFSQPSTILLLGFPTQQRGAIQEGKPRAIRRSRFSTHRGAGFFLNTALCSVLS